MSYCLIQSHRGENWRGIEGGSEIEQKVATFFDDDTVSERVKDVFSSVAIYLLFHSFNATEGRHGLSFGYLLSKFSKVVRFAPYKRTLSSVQFKIIIIVTNYYYLPFLTYCQALAAALMCEQEHWRIIPKARQNSARCIIFEHSIIFDGPAIIAAVKI